MDRFEHVSFRCHSCNCIDAFIQTKDREMPAKIICRHCRKPVLVNLSDVTGRRDFEVASGQMVMSRAR